jgi:hypothetical protein
MPAALVSAWLFVESFSAYSFLRYFDVRSTKRLGQRLDIAKHEVNPLLTLLGRKWGFKAAFRITWVLAASVIAAADTFLGITVSTGIPAAAFFFGTMHLLAAASNTQLDYQTRNLSREEIDAGTYKFVRNLVALDRMGRWGQLLRRYAFTFALTVVSLAVIFLYVSSNLISSTIGLSNLAAAMSNAATVEIVALLLFFPSIFFGTVNWSRRLIKSYKLGRLTPVTITGGKYVEIPVSVAEEALSVAKSNGSSTLRLQIDPASLES